MKLEFLDDISEGGKYPQVVSEQLVRLYDFGPSQALLLKEAIQKKIIDGKDGIATTEKYNFVCSMTIKGFEWMAYLIEPFCAARDSNGYQWLYELDCTIDFLFSPGGTW